MQRATETSGATAGARGPRGPGGATRDAEALLTAAQSVEVDLPIDALAVAKLQREAEADAPVYLAVTCTTAEDYEFADALLTALVQREDAAVAMRKSATVPLYGVIRTVESWFKPWLNALAPAKAHLKKEMGAYRVRQEAAEREARELAAQAAETGDAEALVEALTVATEIAAPTAARATTRFAWQVKRIAEDMLPDEYWTPDMAKINAAAKAAGSSDEAPIIPGVIFERVALIGARR